MTTSGEHLLQVQDLRVSFRLDKHNTFEAVKGISFDVPKNRTIALVGESGSGKSVSAMAILGLLPENASIPATSRVLYGGEDLLKATPQRLQSIRGKDISVIFQDPMTSLNPVFPVGEQNGETLRPATCRRTPSSRSWYLSTRPTGLRGRFAGPASPSTPPIPGGGALRMMEASPSTGRAAWSRGGSALRCGRPTRCCSWRVASHNAPWPRGFCRDCVSFCRPLFWLCTKYCVRLITLPVWRGASWLTRYGTKEC